MVKITYPDGSSKEFKESITGFDIAKGISEGLSRAALAIEVNGELKDLNLEIKNDASIKIITFKDKIGVEIFRHSSAHILAEAVLRLFPKALPTIGPAVEEGFYYDFAIPPLTPEDIEKIEAEINKIIKEKLPFEREEVSKKEALKLFKNNKYKVEMINDLEEGTISIYKMGSFIDLCRGPHVPNTGYIKAIKLMKVSSAYWRGDSKNDSLQRIYGISFSDKKDLKAYLDLLEEAKKRDHRKIGKEMDLFSFHEEAPGMPFWHPKGSIIYNELVKYAKEENRKRNYNEVRTPTILNSELWKVSGHWDNFKESMYFTSIDNQEFAVKPMNCPGGLLIYKTKVHSYKEFPLRNAEFGYVHRHELSGVLSGLFRVRAFTQDDAHSFCTEEQIQDEIIDMVEYAVNLYTMFGFKDIETFIATRPEKSIGSDEVWELGTNALKNALEKKGMPFKIKEGEGAFYGPKIEFNIKDAIGRNWQCGTIQVDFSMPKRFEAVYDSKEGVRKTPVMIHRAILGSLERFIGIVVEHYAGKFPLWISPNQVKVLTVTSRNDDYAKEIISKLKSDEFRVEEDFRSESIPKKVRDAQIQKFNYILVIGDNEEKNKTVNIRTRDNEVLGEKKLADLIKQMKEEIKAKK